MKIGELSTLTGCSVQTIRYYEKEHLLPKTQRSEGNFRLYDDASVEHLLFIKRCRSLDLSLSEIRRLLELRYSPNAPCDEVSHMLSSHINHVRARIEELINLEDQLASLLHSCPSQGTVKKCEILKNLTATQKIMS